ncbi:MAG TPA: hypothetical protein VMV48_02810 [Gallionellaceae bacterium]|nr:hypothetical protein [Gallionellaceae bacterium]
MHAAQQPTGTGNDEYCGEGDGSDDSVFALLPRLRRRGEFAVADGCPDMAHLNVVSVFNKGSQYGFVAGGCSPAH